MESEEKVKSPAYYRFALEKVAIRAAEKYEVVYEGAVIRRKAIDFKERLLKKSTGILNALKITLVITFLINLYLSLPSISVTLRYPKKITKAEGTQKDASDDGDKKTQ